MDLSTYVVYWRKSWEKGGQKLDIVLDPLEGTNFVANNLLNSFSMIAVCEKGKYFQPLIHIWKK